MHICRHYTMIHIYRCFAGSDFLRQDHTRTKHWWLSDYRPLPLLGDAEWDGQGWFFDQELGLITWVACLKKTPGTLETWDTFRIWCLPLDAEYFHSSSYHCCFYCPFFSSLDGCQHHRQAATMGIGLSLLVAFLVLLATTCNWWSSSLGLICGLDTLEEKRDSKRLPPKMNACPPKKGPSPKEITSSNPWFFTGYSCVLGGKDLVLKLRAETSSSSTWKLLSLEWKGVGCRVCSWKGRSPRLQNCKAEMKKSGIDNCTPTVPL